MLRKTKQKIPSAKTIELEKLETGGSSSCHRAFSCDADIESLKRLTSPSHPRGATWRQPLTSARRAVPEIGCWVLMEMGRVEVVKENYAAPPLSHHRERRGGTAEKCLVSRTVVVSVALRSLQGPAYTTLTSDKPKLTVPQKRGRQIDKRS